MKLHCLGTVGYHPNDARHTSCYFLPESGILLDAGSGVFRLAKYIETDTLDVLLSHAHLDHTFGLTFLLDVLFERHVETVRIWGEAAKIDAVKNHLFNELIFPATLDCQWNAIDDLATINIRDTKIAWRQQDHPGGSVAYRIDWESQSKRLVYATDTVGDTTDEHADWCENADLLMHECYFRDEAAEWAIKTGHSWTSRVAEVAAKSNPAKLLLTHINPIETSDDPVDIDQIISRVKSDVMLAQDGMSVNF